MSVELFLVDEANEFQQLLREEAALAAQRTGLKLATRFTGDDFSAQLAQLRSCIVTHPEAILVSAPTKWRPAASRAGSSGSWRPPARRCSTSRAAAGAW